MSSAIPEGPSDPGNDDPWKPDALSEIDKPSLSDGVGEVKEGASKLAHGVVLLLIAIIAIIVAFANRDSGEGSLDVRFMETDQGWVARLKNNEIRSSAMPSKEDAFSDLMETIQLQTGDLELSKETLQAIEESEGELERGETVSLEDLSKDLDSQPT